MSRQLRTNVSRPEIAYDSRTKQGRPCQIHRVCRLKDMKTSVLSCESRAEKILVASIGHQTCGAYSLSQMNRNETYEIFKIIPLKPYPSKDCFPPLSLKWHLQDEFSDRKSRVSDGRGGRHRLYEPQIRLSGLLPSALWSSSIPWHRNKCSATCTDHFS